MAKAFLYRLFGLGRIPKGVRPALASEGIVLCDEGIRVWVITRNFRSGHRRSWRRMSGFAGCLVITEKRVVAYAFWKRLVNIPLDDSRLRSLQMKLAGTRRLDLTFEASVFNPNISGEITIRFYTDQARRFCDRLVEACRALPETS